MTTPNTTAARPSWQQALLRAHSEVPPVSADNPPEPEGPSRKRKAADYYRLWRPHVLADQLSGLPPDVWLCWYALRGMLKSEGTGEVNRRKLAVHMGGMDQDRIEVALVSLEVAGVLVRDREDYLLRNALAHEHRKQQTRRMDELQRGGWDLGLVAAFTTAKPVQPRARTRASAEEPRNQGTNKPRKTSALTRKPPPFDKSAFPNGQQPWKREAIYVPSVDETRQRQRPSSRPASHPQPAPRADGAVGVEEKPRAPTAPPGKDVTAAEFKALLKSKRLLKAMPEPLDETSPEHRDARARSREEQRRVVGRLMVEATR